jgi:hypothetical protein
MLYLRRGTIKYLDTQIVHSDDVLTVAVIFNIALYELIIAFRQLEMFAEDAIVAYFTVPSCH